MSEEIKNSKFQVRLPLLVALGVAFGMLVGANMFRPTTGKNAQAISQAYLKFRDILSYIDRDYVDSVDTEALSDYAIEKMLEKLDPHTSYIPANEMIVANSYLEGDFDGIGVEFNIFQDTIFVISPISGGPSESAGLKPSDRIIKVNGQNVAGVKITNQEVFEKLRGPKGTRVTLTILRKESKKPLNYVITRNKIPTTSVDVSYMIDPQTGYIKINRFSANTYDEFKEALVAMRQKGMTRLVLDLRDNPGGYMDKATKIADEFISGNKKIVYTEGKGVRYDSETYAQTRGDFEEGALVVLINEGSASASEILAGALQDNDRALLVGRRSFGKGLVQMPIPLTDGSELRLTISRYYTPSGRSIQKSYKTGVEDYESDLVRRFQHGEIFNPDSIHFDDSLKFKTRKGRLVYGGGGIMPDVFVAPDTSENSRFLTELYSKNIIREFALIYYHDHQRSFKKMPFEKFRSEFVVTDEMLEDLVKKAQQAKIAVDERGFKRSRNLIKNNLKASIARSIYGPVGFFPIYHEKDREFQQAIKLFGEAEKIYSGPNRGLGVKN